MTAAPVSELFDVKDVIYLTPDAEDMLEELDKDKVYIIGGIVDESIIKVGGMYHKASSRLVECIIKYHQGWWNV